MLVAKGMAIKRAQMDGQAGQVDEACACSNVSPVATGLGVKQEQKTRQIAGLWGREISVLLLGLAGAHAEHGIGRAESDGAGQQRHHAYPSPQTDGPGRGQGNQNESGHNAQCTIDTASITFHLHLLYVVDDVA